jgi:hypothetical protein
LGRRVFFADLPETKLISLKEALEPLAKGNSLIVVCTRSDSRRSVKDRPDEVTYLNLAAVEVWQQEPVFPRLEENVPTICLDYFDHRIEELPWNRRLLAFIEELVYVRRKRVFLLTSREPDALLIKGATDEKPPAWDGERWARVLGRFVKVEVTDTASEDLAGKRNGNLEELLKQDFRKRGPKLDESSKRRLKEIHATLRHECVGRLKLEEVARQILKLDLRRLSPQGVGDLIREGADTYYAALWAVLGEEEKLVVAQLAEGAAVNPNCRHSLRRLLARGLVKRDPELRLMNETFSQFIRETVPRSLVAKWEGGTESTWRLIRGPITVGLIAIALFLFWTQSDVLGNALALLSTAGASLLVITRLMALYQGPTDRAGGTASA